MRATNQKERSTDFDYSKTIWSKLLEGSAIFVSILSLQEIENGKHFVAKLTF